MPCGHNSAASGSGSDLYNESETITKFEIMDGTFVGKTLLCWFVSSESVFKLGIGDSDLCVMSVQGRPCVASRFRFGSSCLDSTSLPRSATSITSSASSKSLSFLRDTAQHTSPTLSRVLFHSIPECQVKLGPKIWGAGII